MRTLLQDAKQGYADVRHENDISDVILRSDVDCKEEFHKMREKGRLPAVAYLSGTLAGAIAGTVTSLYLEHGTNFKMGYETAFSQVQDNGNTPFGRPVEYLEKVFGGKMYSLGKRTFTIEHKIRSLM